MSKQSYQSPRGTKDILPTDQQYWQRVADESFKILEGLGIERIDVPYFENAEIYGRGIGLDSDIVTKEMFMLEKTGGDEGVAYALRPEGTAGVIRSYIQNGMSSWPQPVRLYYYGPMFRRERPQKGRYREFYQLGVEIVGDPSPKSDYLAIMSAWEILNRLGLKDIIVYTNSIGCQKCRPKFQAKLKKYYKDKIKNLCEDCIRRYEKNPLRLLDCKEEKCQNLSKNAPTTLDSLCSECKTHFQNTLEYLDYFNIRYDLDPKLVRGLDYYTNTVFEIGSKDDKSRQSSIGGGGRYNGLVELLGGISTPAVGYSLGIERIISLMKEQKIKLPLKRGVDVCILQLGEKAKEASKNIYDELTKADLNVFFVPSNDGLRQQLGSASRIGAKYVVIIGQREAMKDEAILRDLSASTQETFPSSSLASEVKKRIDK
ncbi:MAG: histidine--tRNA ligase [Patescibacteria group bacterium]